MAATVEVRVSYGDSASRTDEASDATKLPLVNDDVASSVDSANYPITMPSSGNNYSYERWFRALVSSLGGSSIVKNFRVFADTATLASGATINFGQNTTYVTPVNSASSYAGTAIPETEPTENLYIGGASGGEITADGSYSDWGILQLLVPNTATLTASSATLTVMWDEVA